MTPVPLTLTAYVGSSDFAQQATPSASQSRTYRLTAHKGAGPRTANPSSGPSAPAASWAGGTRAEGRAARVVEPAPAAVELPTVTVRAPSRVLAAGDAP